MSKKQIAVIVVTGIIFLGIGIGAGWLIFAKPFSAPNTNQNDQSQITASPTATPIITNSPSPTANSTTTTFKYGADEQGKERQLIFTHPKTVTTKQVHKLCKDNEEGPCFDNHTITFSLPNATLTIASNQSLAAASIGFNELKNQGYELIQVANNTYRIAKDGVYYYASAYERTSGQCDPEGENLCFVDTSTFVWTESLFVAKVTFSKNATTAQRTDALRIADGIITGAN